MTRSVLIVDDDPVQRRLLEAAVTKFGHQAIVTDSGEAGLAALERDGHDIAVVVLDLVMPGTDGHGVLQRMREREIATPVIVQTAQGGIETVVNAMRHGAFDFVVKPASPERLNKAITDAMKVEAVGDRARKLTRRSALPSFKDFSTKSAAMEKALKLAQKAAASDIPILIEGESGAGKEFVARAIQAASDRRGKPFVTVNCGAIPDNLVESILFGHEKGSFTGATEKHAGKFVEAHGGTLFLDEIGDLPLHVQVKLLRAVQDGEVDPVGGRSTVKVDIRLISATHRDLLQQVKDGKFREDLFYRLNVYPIVVPPLRDRRSDLAQLVNRFISRFGNAGANHVHGISGPAMEMLQAYDWPGNIRQLENTIFRACVLSEGDVLTEAEFPHIRAQMNGLSGLDPIEDENGNTGQPVSFDASEIESLAVRSAVAELNSAAGLLRALDERGNVRSLADVELEMIKLAIDHYDGQMSEVARRLGIGRSTLYRKLKEYGLDSDETDEDRLAG
jgi:DNA-binding NtrC family response regulator